MHKNMGLVQKGQSVETPLAKPAAQYASIREDGVFEGQRRVGGRVTEAKTRKLAPGAYLNESNQGHGTGERTWHG